MRRAIVQDVRESRMGIVLGNKIKQAIRNVANPYLVDITLSDERVIEAVWIEHTNRLIFERLEWYATVTTAADPRHWRLVEWQVAIDEAMQHFDNPTTAPVESQAGSATPAPVAQLTWNDPRVRLPRIKTGLISEDVLIAMADDAGRFTYRSACAVYYTIPQRGVTISHWVVGTPNGLDSTIGAHAVGGWAYFNPYFADTDALPLIDA